MTAQISEPPREYLTAAQVADRLQVPVDTLRKWREVGKGPRYARIGRHVRYRLADVDAWAEALTVTPGAA